MKRIKTSELIPGLVLAEDVYNFNGEKIFSKGLVLNDKQITRLEFYSILSVRIEDDVDVTSLADNSNSEPNPDTTSLSTIITQSQDYIEFKNSFDDTLDDFKSQINNVIESNADIDVDSLMGNTKDLISKAKNSSYSTMDMLCNMRQYDDLTFAHSLNVSLLCNVFAGWLKLSEEDTDTLTLCGLLHDLGKLKIPDSIIKKPAKLTSDEYQIVKTHTVEGYNLLKNHNISPHVVNSALMHHEKCDGSGYPFGLSADKIDSYAKIVAIVDVYDAMTSARIYRGPLCPFRVIELYENEGLQKYDAYYIMTFLENVSNTYLHYQCKLSDGRIGKIIFINKNNLSKPIVKCGSEMVDLSKEKDLHVDAIL